MSKELVSVIDAAAQLGRCKQTVFKVLRRLGIEATRRRDSSRGNQLVSYITQDQFRRVRAELSPNAPASEVTTTDAENGSNSLSTQQGLFYLVQLEPRDDPGRFKVGYAANVSDRLRALRCSAPFAQVVRTWPCRRLWEKTAIDCVTPGCEQVHTEVFRTDSLDDVAKRCERFFELMPDPHVS